MIECSISLHLYVKCYGHRLAMCFHAPRGIFLQSFFVYSKILLEYKMMRSLLFVWVPLFANKDIFELTFGAWHEKVFQDEYW